MSMNILIVLGGACVLGALASFVLSWASNRSALFNLVFGSLLAFAVLAGALLIALLMTRAAYGR